MRQPLLTARGVDPVDAHGRLAALGPPSVLRLGHVLDADGYLFLRYRRR